MAQSSRAKVLGVRVPATALIVLLLIFTSACATKVDRFPVTPPSPPLADTHYHVLRGLFFEVEQDFPAALKELHTALAYDPEDYFLIGRVALLSLKAGKPQEAITYSQKLLARDPNSVTTLHILATAYTATGQHQAAISAYDNILKIQPHEADAYFSLAVIYAGQNNLSKTEEMIQKGASMAPDSPIGHYYLGKLALQKKAFDKALSSFEKAILLSPEFEQAHLEIAKIYEHQEQWGPARDVYLRIRERINPESEGAARGLIPLLIREKSWEEALILLNGLAQQHPDDVDIPLQIALIWAEQKEYIKAIDFLLPRVSDRPETLHLQRYLAALYEETEDFEKAIAIYQKILLKAQHVYEIHLRIGAIRYYKLRQVQEALLQGKQAMAVDAKKADAYLFNGMILNDLNRYEEAVATFLSGIEQGAGVPDLHFHLGATYDKLNRYDDLVMEMQKTIRMDAKHAEALNYLGYTYAEKGEHLDEAIEMIERAISIYPDNGYYVDSLGWAYYKKGKIKEARSHLEKAIALAPEDPVIHEHLGEVYFKEKQVDLARESWNRALRLNPKNDKLISRYKETGFGDPPLSPSSGEKRDIEKALPKTPSKPGQTEAPL